MGEAHIELQWHFQPADYFEQAITVSRENYTMVIDKGMATATIEAAVYDANPAMRDDLHQAMKARFLAVQLLNYKEFELSRPTTMRVDPDGRRDLSIELEPGTIRISSGVVNYRITDKDGKVVSDSARDRMDEKNNLADLVSLRSGDKLLMALLASHNNSVNDPNNELTHLYEIRDALTEKFGDEKQTRAAIGLSRASWSRFGRLCNHEPLKQGRHRGQYVGNLRDATHSELEEARGIARSMIEGYLRLL